MRIRPVTKIGETLSECQRCGWVYPDKELRSGICPDCTDKPHGKDKRKIKRDY